MKKLLTFFLALCLMVTAFCVTAFCVTASADDPVVLRVAGLKADDTLYYPENCGYTKFDEGWEAAIDYAENKKWISDNEIVRVVVDLYADWIANDDGEFGSGGDGFNYSTIHIPSNVKIMLNMNGHTINRKLSKCEYDGEVILIDSGADVIINGGKNLDPIARADDETATVQFGTITGGFSCNGAGGIHIDDAKVTLNNVKVENNKSEDDDGGGIATYNKSTLIVNGGSISDNVAYMDSMQAEVAMYGGGVYADDGKLVLNNVLLSNNCTLNDSDEGGAIAALDCDVTVKSCKVIGNATNDDDACSVFYFEDSDVNISKTTFINNGQKGRDKTLILGTDGDFRSVISLEDSKLNMSECAFDNNSAVYLLDIHDSSINISKTDFTDGNAMAMYGETRGSENTVDNCQFSKGNSYGENSNSIDLDEDSEVTYTDCDFGDANNPTLAGSIFGGGSMTMIVSFAAIAVSIAAIGVSLATKKKDKTAE